MLPPRAVLLPVALFALAAPSSASAAKAADHRSCPAAVAGPAIGYDLPEPRFVHSRLETNGLSCIKGEAIMDAFAQRHEWPVGDESFTTRIRSYRCVARFEFDDRWADGTVSCKKGIRKIKWVASGPAPDGPGDGLD